MAPPVKQEEKSEFAQLKARLDQLESENKALKRERASMEAEVQDTVARRLAGNGNTPRELKPEHKGAVTYRVGSRYYRQGRMYEAGEKITVVDEIPGKDWTVVTSAAPVEVEVVPEPKSQVPSV